MPWSHSIENGVPTPTLGEVCLNLEADLWTTRTAILTTFAPDKLSSRHPTWCLLIKQTVYINIASVSVASFSGSLHIQAILMYGIDVSNLNKT